MQLALLMVAEESLRASLTYISCRALGFGGVKTGAYMSCEWLVNNPALAWLTAVRFEIFGGQTNILASSRHPAKGIRQIGLFKVDSAGKRRLLCSCHRSSM